MAAERCRQVRLEERWINTSRSSETASGRDRTPVRRPAATSSPFIPALVVDKAERRRSAGSGSLDGRIALHDRVESLSKWLEINDSSIVVVETRDTEGYPVAGGIRQWIQSAPPRLVIVWTAGGRAALQEILDLACVGAEVRLVLRGRDDLRDTLVELLRTSAFSSGGAVSSLLRGVVRCAPMVVQPELTMGAFHAWPRPSVGAWSKALQLSPQALNARLRGSGCATARVVLDSFTAAEIAFRCSSGIKLKDLAAVMGRSDDRPLRRRLHTLSCRPEHLRDDADFRGLLPRIVETLKR